MSGLNIEYRNDQEEHDESCDWEEDEHKFYEEVLAHNYEDELICVQDELEKFAEEHPESLDKSNIDQYKAKLFASLGSMFDSIEKSWLDRDARLGYTEKEVNIIESSSDDDDN
jgi:hypothetical protein